MEKDALTTANHVQEKSQSTRLQEKDVPNHLQEMSQSSQPSRLQKKDMENGFGLTFEQEQTADQLLADIQSAVDEMLQEFQMSPLPPASEPTVTSPVSGLPTL